jgi:isopentenyldiphosphate isomerase
MAEIFDIVDSEGAVIGSAPRSECHGNPSLVHRTAHVVVFSSDGSILLQKRAADKDIQPGKWDTAVGGHLALGEDYETAARRELAEELGLPENTPLRFLFDSRIRNEIESENVRVFATVHDGPFLFQKSEIDEVRFWSEDEIAAVLGKGVLTPNLEAEVGELRKRGISHESIGGE